MTMGSEAGTPIQHFASEDGSMSVEFRSAVDPSNDIKSLSVLWQGQPRYGSYYYNFENLAADRSAELEFWANAAIIDPQYNHSVAITAPCFRGLGYGFTYEAQPDPIADTETAKGVYTYPSAARLNRILDDVFGSDDGGLRFEEHSGGEFSAIDSVRALVMRGTVLVATNQPYELHDLTGHAPGFIGMGPKLIRLLRERMGIYLEQFDSGRESFTPPVFEDASQQAKIIDYFQPTRQVLLGCAHALDLVSDRISEDLVLPSRHGDTPFALRSTLSAHLKSISVSTLRQEYMSEDFLGLSGEDTLQHANDILDRYDALSKALV